MEEQSFCWFIKAEFHPGLTFTPHVLLLSDAHRHLEANSLLGSICWSLFLFYFLFKKIR